MARVYWELTPEEVLAIWQLDWIADNSMIYKDNTWIYQAVALWAAWTSPVSNGATSAPTFQVIGAWDLKADGSVPMTWALDFVKGADIPSATSTDIWAATWNFVDITWTTTIANFWASASWVTRRLRFTWILTLTYNATQMILPWNASIITAVWDTATFVSLWSWDWICTSYQREDWTAIVWTWSWDVVWPASATDAVPVLFNWTTGKLVKNSTPTWTGNPVLATSPTLVTPALWTPASWVMTNVTWTAASLIAWTATVANWLKSATTTVSVSAATAPTVWQVLTAVNWTTATWQAGWWWGWASAPHFNVDIAWTQIVWKLYTYVCNAAVTAWTFRSSLWVLPSWSTLIVNLHKNWTIDATCTHTAWDSATNWLYPQTDTTFVSWSYVAWDVLTVEISQIWTTIAWADLTFSLFE